MPRHKNFDVDAALEKAAEVFWDKGYDATSMTDLLAAMGIQKGSFYDTYGSKRDAYLRALEDYSNRQFAALLDSIAGKGPRESIEFAIQAALADCSSPKGHRGCMVLNCALELAHTDTGAQRIVRQSFSTFEEGYETLIRAAQAAGEVSQDLDASATAKAILALLMGMRVHVRAGAPRSTLEVLAGQALGLLKP